MKSKNAEIAITCGIKYLENILHANGAFLIQQKTPDNTALAVKTPFTTALILAALFSSKQAEPKISDRINSLVKIAIPYLQSQIDQNGRVCFFGINSSYNRDIDDTTTVWHTLQCYNAHPKGEKYDLLSEHIIPMIDQNGQVMIWWEREDNGIRDWVISANVLRYLSLEMPHLGATLEKSIKAIISSGNWKKGSPYYGDPYVAIAIGIGLGGAPLKCLSISAREELKKHLISVSTSINKERLPFIAFTLRLLTADIPSTIRTSLLNAQRNDGSWSNTTLFRHTNRPYSYVDSAVPTAFALATLIET